MKRLSETIGRIGCAASVFKEPSPVLPRSIARRQLH